MNFAMEVHGAQEFRWRPLVIAGDEITTRASVKDIYEGAGRVLRLRDGLGQRARRNCLHRRMDGHCQERPRRTPTLRVIYR
jgi:hypothetical protein